MMATEMGRVEVPERVCQIVLPEGARELSTLSRVDYEDAFVVDVGGQRTAQEWARAVFNDAPLAVRARLVSGWMGLGLKLGAPWSAAAGAGLEGAAEQPRGHAPRRGLGPRPPGRVAVQNRSSRPVVRDAHPAEQLRGTSRMGPDNRQASGGGPLAARSCRPPRGVGDRSPTNGVMTSRAQDPTVT